MGETTDELKTHLNGHSKTTDSTLDASSHVAPTSTQMAEVVSPEPQERDDVSTLRNKIEETRDDLSGTIDALQSKLDPQRVKQQLSERLHESTVERAQHFAQTARDKIADAMGAVQHAIRHDEIAGEGPGAHNRAVSFLKPIHEQVVVVFGASSGIGRETAIQFARRGAKVVVAARSEDGLTSLVESIHNARGEAAYQVADVTNLAQVQAVAQKAVDEFGRIDTWVHCAAISLYATAEETTPEEFRRVLDVNLVGTVNGALAALPHLKSGGQGALICISSVEGKRALPFQAAYAASKHGIIGFLDALRVELQHEGAHISVTNVMPAGINTPFFNHARTKLGVKPQPVPPIYQPSVVAEAILHAAEHPTRDIVAGGAAKMMTAMQRVAPGLMDAIVSRSSFEGQKTGELKPLDAPDNFYEPLKGYNHVGGDFTNKAKSRSFGTWLETHPKAQQALKGAALGLALLIILRRR